MFSDYSMSELGAIFAMQGFAGLILFSVFVLMALGLAIIFGQMGVINMAHGEFMILGAYMTYLTSNVFATYLPGVFGAYFFVAMVLAFIVSGALGLFVEWAMIRHLYKRPLDTLLATWGLSLILQQVYRSVFGAREVGVTIPDWMMGSLPVSDMIEVPINGIFVMVLATGISLAVYYMMFRSQLGPAGAGDQPEPGDGRCGRHQHRLDRPSDLRHRLRRRRGRGIGLHDDRLDRADGGAALHRRHVPRGGLRRGGQPSGHDRQRVLDQPGAVDHGVLPVGLDGQGADAPRRGGDPDDPPAGPVFPQTAQVTGGRSMERSSNRLFTTRDIVGFAILAAIVFVVLPVTLDSFRLNLFGKYLTYAFVAVGLVLCWGAGGILSLGQGVFFGLGGYCMAMFLKLEASTPENTAIQSTPGIPDFMDWNQLTALPWWWEPFPRSPSRWSRW